MSGNPTNQELAQPHLGAALDVNHWNLMAM
jgi:hypothetical protein